MWLTVVEENGVKSLHPVEVGRGEGEEGRGKWGEGRGGGGGGGGRGGGRGERGEGRSWDSRCALRGTITAHTFFVFRTNSHHRLSVEYGHQVILELS